MSNEPDGFEKKIRFGCGGLFGLVVGFYSVSRLFLTSDEIIKFSIVMIFSVYICGYMAMKQGDKFWHSIKEKLWRFD